MDAYHHDRTGAYNPDLAGPWNQGPMGPYNPNPMGTYQHDNTCDYDPSLLAAWNQEQMGALNPNPVGTYGQGQMDSHYQSQIDSHQPSYLNPQYATNIDDLTGIFQLPKPIKTRSNQSPRAERFHDGSQTTRADHSAYQNPDVRKQWPSLDTSTPLI